MAGSLRINVQLGPDGIGQERSIFTWLKVCITRLRQYQPTNPCAGKGNDERGMLFT